MGLLQPFSIDQGAGALALLLGSIGGLLMIVWKSRCKTIRCCYGLVDCVRDPNSQDSSEEDNPTVDEVIVPPEAVVQNPPPVVPPVVAP